jgi:hypothetical protein
MSNVQNPMADIYHSQLEASRRFAEVLFSGTERIDHVVIEATHHAFTNQLNLAHAAVSVRDPKELANIQSNMLAHRPDNAINFQKEMMRVFAEIENEMGKSMKEYIEKFGSSISRGATAPLKSAQEKSADAMTNPMTGMFSLWETAFREVASMTNKNLAATTTTMQQAAEDVMHTTVQVGESSADQTAGIAKIAAQAAAEAAATVLHEHLNSTRQGPNGATSVASAAAADHAPGRTEEKETIDENRSHTSGARRK